MENVNGKVTRRLYLRTIFLGYLALLCTGMLLWLGVIFTAYLIGTASGEILPANYVEKQIAAAKDTLVTSREITPDQVPFLADYAVYTKEGDFLYGSLGPKKAKEAWEAIPSNSNRGIYRYYTLIPREREGEAIILSYSVVMHFRSEWLRTYLPIPEVLGAILFVLGFLLQIVVWSFLFGKKLTKKMAGLQAVTQKIQNQDLEFSVESSGVQEIDTVLSALDTMKNELKSSLRQQWEQQQTRREQIAALAHDIKTPLTIIRGNAELLGETVQDEAQQEYNRYILNSTVQIERYARELIDIAKSQEGMNLVPVSVYTGDLLAEIEEQMKALAVEKELHVQMTVFSFPEFIAIDKGLFNRALLNVLMNAVEHTPLQGTISLTAEGNRDSVRFIVGNSGSRFSSADLRDATKQFYMGDRSRSSGEHHGMGLYITQSIMQQHSGNVILANDEASGMAKVTMELPWS